MICALKFSSDQFVQLELIRVLLYVHVPICKQSIKCMDFRYTQGWV